MATLIELISELELEISPNVSDDSVLDRRLLAHWIHKQRALWLRNELNKPYRTIDYGITQQILLDIEVADEEDDLVGIGEGFSLFKSTQNLPNLIELHNNAAIVRVTSVWDEESELPKSRYTLPLKVIDFTNIPYSGHGKFTSNKVFVYPLDTKLYLVQPDEDSYYDIITKVKLIGVFENPEDVTGFSESSRYPVSVAMWNYIKGTIIKEDLRNFYIPIEDKLNNATNDITRTGSNEEKD